jgi:RNA ligase
MDYQFPRIERLDDVLPAIEGRDEFIVAQREWGTVVNYLMSMADTFPAVDTPLDAIRRECRGILFYPDGRIMSRRLHKFFNVNERDETAAHLIDLGRPHVILEKLDGSMITPVFTEAGVRWGTKMGLTDVGMGAEVFVAQHPQYQELALQCLEGGQTPIFEWCTRKQRIVVDYPDDRLVLIAIRDNITGEYMAYPYLQFIGEQYGIEVVKAYAGTTENMQHLIDETRGAEGIEGWIIRFDDGQMLKVKGEWYVRIHKAKDALVHEKNVVEMLVNEAVDDVKGFLLDEDRKRVEAFETDFWIGIADTVRKYEDYFQALQAINMDRKTWAIEHMPAVQKQNPFTPAVVFGMFDSKDVRKMVLDAVRKNMGTQTKVDAVRLLWGGAKWNYSFDGDT